ncbi:mobile mystery protein A [Parashewanella spongiae]|uniref:Mobile mystery protein A n=2 Tax=Parashewanella spongiae TaxID=342950 RepID=A0A3A6T9F0_9GAMM|nr:mobile mystery protein A [Parashewanella spongiae]MCL1079964.1 mobile mystery protein A [Parashewanella spongiae]RJY06015.1 mobile mystery protein A [Parashewanella spongiae]
MYSFQSNPNKQQPVKKTVLRQYRELVDAVKGTLFPLTPKEGWIRTVRKALDMSGAQLGDRAGLTRNRVSVLERREVDGDITLNQLKQLAEALDCDFSYTLKPKKTISDIMQERALKVAKVEVKKASKNMFLEAQSISKEKENILISELAEEIMRAGGRKLWGKNKEGKVF